MVNKEKFRSGLSIVVSGLTGSTVDACSSVVNGVIDKGREIIDDIKIRIRKKEKTSGKNENSDMEK
jgi:hypothetical protein